MPTWPQWIMAGWLVLIVVHGIMNHGQKKTIDGSYSMAAAGLLAALMGFGGFWDAAQ